MLFILLATQLALAGGTTTKTGDTGDTGDTGVGDSGTADSGTADSGTADGGTTDGGTVTDGGTTDGGTTVDGGTTDDSGEAWVEGGDKIHERAGEEGGFGCASSSAAVVFGVSALLLGMRRED